MKLGDTQYTDRGPLLNSSIIAAYVPDHPHEGGEIRHAVVLPWSEGFRVMVSTTLVWGIPSHGEYYPGLRNSDSW